MIVGNIVGKVNVVKANQQLWLRTIVENELTMVSMVTLEGRFSLKRRPCSRHHTPLLLPFNCCPCL